MPGVKTSFVAEQAALSMILFPEFFFFGKLNEPQKRMTLEI